MGGTADYSSLEFFKGLFICKGVSMNEYKKLSEKQIDQTEKEIANYWNDIDLLKLSITERPEDKHFVFYDGPPTANGRPGIHHVISRALKDSVCRYKTMNGYRVERKAGWDTHGLPVEIEVEKRLSLNNKTEIENYGITNFNTKCRESVFEYESSWREMSERMAYLIDMDNPYITLDNNYIESVWWILDKFNKEGYIYDGHKILPYCTRCGTGLASHEVAQGYQEIKSQTVVAKFKRKDADEYFLVWTTTPWTLPSNVALAVHPNETYVKAKQDGVVYILEKSLASTVMGEDHEIIEEMKGKDLEYVEYEQLMPYVKPDKKAFFVTCAEFVTTEDGTGVVHMAPAFGEDDYNVCRGYNLPVLKPVGEDGKFTDTPWKGTFVMDADLDIIIHLGEQGKVYKKEKMAHNYPHCWRCKTPLLYYAKPSWYIEMTKFREQLMANNDTVNWFPGYVGEKRFGNWLENVNDWAISRSRYWGTPLPLWKCECGNITSVGSRKELVDLAIEDIDESIDLHRPHVDHVHLTCDKCGKPMTRVKDVIDCWFDSGAMPFAQYHYPFENKEKFDTLFPADFICEGIDQTRGWYYSLLAISTFVKGQSPYKNVLVNDLILDKFGKKMSKSKGNTVDPFELFDKYGADVLRWYLYFVSPAWTPTKFDEEGVKEVESKFFRTIKNVYNFFTLYANTDKINAKEFYVEPLNRPELDRWMLSKLNNLIKRTREDMDVFDTTKAVRRLQDFVNEDFSNWYIRRSRRRFWSETLDDDKKAVYNTTFEVLETICRLAAPFAPYITEEIYRNLTGEKSVHLAAYPVCDEKLIDQNTEDRMDLIKSLVTLGRAARESVKIKVRQPISNALLDGKHKALISDLTDLIKEELNVKEVTFADDLSKYMNFSLKPNFKVAGPVLGKNMGLFSKALSSLDPYETAVKLEAGESILLDIAGEEKEFDKEMILVNISAREGFTVRMENNLFIILDTNLTEDLIYEGYARELISRVQQLRKSYDFDMMDNIKIEYHSTDEFNKAVEMHKEYIMKETLAKELIKVEENDFEEFTLNEQKTALKVTKL